MADWIDGEIDLTRHKDSRLRSGRLERRAEDPLFMSWKEYLKFEALSSRRHEYINGAVYAVGDESLAHNLIAQAIVAAFRSHLRVERFEPFFLQVKLEIEAGRDRIVYYPDAMVSCRPEDTTEQVVRNPKLVVEILSRSTLDIDRREKAMTYQRVDAIEEYVLIAQNQPKVIVHRRAEGWRPNIYSSIGAAVEFRSIGLHVPLAQIYEWVLGG
jgi:Uma2 family endonuclease